MRQNQELRDKFFGNELETLKNSMISLQRDTLALHVLTGQLQETNNELNRREADAQNRLQILADAVRGLNGGQALLDSIFG